MAIELTETYVVYQAKTRLANLAYEIAQVRDLRKTQDKARLATKIRLWLKALDYGVYLDRTTREKIWYCLADMADVNALPYAPVLGVTEPPTIVVGVPGTRGERGERGEDGGATDFSASDLVIDSVVDSFDVSDALAARWDYVVYGSTGQRAGTVIGTWTSDGVSFTDSGDQSTEDVTGTTAGVSFAVDVTGATVRLIATITTGTWNVRGSRYFIPNNGAGVSSPSTLTSAKIWVGNSSNVPTEQSVSGAFTLSNTGVATLSNGYITNIHISSSAAIALSKLAALTASKVAVTNSSGVITTSSLNASQLTYLTNVTSDIQTQIDAIASAGAITGAITTVVTNDLTASRVVVSNVLGKIAVSTVTTTELAYLSGVTSAIQTQLDGKVNDTGDIITGALEVQDGIRTETTGPYLKTRIFEIPAWNMDSTSALTVTVTGLDTTKIRSVTGVVRSDDNFAGSGLIQNFPLGGYMDNTTSGTNNDLGIGAMYPSGANTAIVLRRRDTSTFDSADFDSTSHIRGWLTIQYEA